MSTVADRSLDVSASKLTTASSLPRSLQQETVQRGLRFVSVEGTIAGSAERVRLGARSISFQNTGAARWIACSLVNFPMGAASCAWMWRPCTMAHSVIGARQRKSIEWRDRPTDRVLGAAFDGGATISESSGVKNEKHLSQRMTNSLHRCEL